VMLQQIQVDSRFRGNDGDKRMTAMSRDGHGEA
jgi:hypothetical protein